MIEAKKGAAVPSSSLTIGCLSACFAAFIKVPITMCVGVRGNHAGKTSAVIELGLAVYGRKLNQRMCRESWLHERAQRGGGVSGKMGEWGSCGLDLKDRSAAIWGVMWIPVRYRCLMTPMASQTLPSTLNLSACPSRHEPRFRLGSCYPRPDFLLY